MWKGLAVASILVSGGGIALGLYGNSIRHDAEQLMCDNGGYTDSGPTDVDNKPCRGVMPTDTLRANIDTWNADGEKGQNLGRAGLTIAITAGGFALVAIYKGFIEKNPPSSKEHASRGERVRRPRYAVTPVISPNGGGATLRFDW
jgi:hypothetical protein